MPVLAIEALSLEACRATIVDLFARQDSPVHFIEVRLLNSAGVQVGMGEWRPNEDEGLRATVERISSYIMEHKGADATIRIKMAEGERS